MLGTAGPDSHYAQEYAEAQAEAQARAQQMFGQRFRPFPRSCPGPPGAFTRPSRSP